MSVIKSIEVPPCVCNDFFFWSEATIIQGYTGISASNTLNYISFLIVQVIELNTFFMFFLCV